MQLWPGNSAWTAIPLMCCWTPTAGNWDGRLAISTAGRRLSSANSTGSANSEYLSRIGEAVKILTVKNWFETSMGHTRPTSSNPDTPEIAADNRQISGYGKRCPSDPFDLSPAIIIHRQSIRTQLPPGRKNHEVCAVGFCDCAI